MDRPASHEGATPIAPGVFWVGALDPDLRIFDLILRTANGTSYNAYLVRGEQGVAIVDTVKEAFAEVFFRRIASVARYDEITAIVLNHLEPDHSGALPELLRRAPQARVYLSLKAQPMLKALLKPSFPAPPPYTPVGEGDVVELGGRQLEFVPTPYLHWPDTQCTFVRDVGVLFSGDIFGCHFCDARLFDDQVGDFRFSFDYYYAHIMRPFRAHVAQALDRLEALPIQLIAPAHGPILRQRPWDYVRRYRQLCTRHGALEGEKTLLIFYLSAYGNTRRMAEAVHAGAESIPGVRVSLYDLAGGDVAALIDLIEEADGIAFGCPTINGDAVKPVWDLLSSLTAVPVQGKLGAAFGSYGWSGEAVELIEHRLRGLKLRVPLPGLRIKLAPTSEELADCQEFGRQLARHLTGCAVPKTIDLADLA